MDPNLLHLVVAGGLTLVGIVITAIIWRAAKVRTVLWWLGLSLLPIAVHLLGLSPQVVGAYETLRAGYAVVSLTPVVWVGIVLAALGVLLMLVSRFVPPRPRRQPAAPASPPPTSPAAPTPAVSARTDSRPAAPQPRRTSASQPTPADSDLDEVTEILRRRGIE